MKILPTIGPETIKTNNLKYILKRTNIVRINSSHNSIAWHKKAISKIKKINSSCVILIDFPGVKPRTINYSDTKIKKNQIVTFSFKKTTKKSTILLSKPLPKIINKRFFSLDDGKIIFKTVSFNKNYITGRALNNCLIKPKKGLNIPNSIYDNKTQEKTYLKYFKIFEKTKIDAVGLSFIQNKNIISKLKKKYPDIIFVSKIENSEGLKNVEEISKYSDAIMIDRGDLSAEVGDENLYDGINKISIFCKKFGRPLIMATENLETFYKNNNPSRNDIVSLGFSKQINSDMIMLSEETALSLRWKKIFSWLHNFLNIKENNEQNKYPSDIFWQISESVKNYTLVVFSKKGLMFNKIFQNNINNKVIVFTDTKKTLNLSKYYKNTICIMTKRFDNKNINKFYLSYLKKYKKIIFAKSNIAFLIAISFPKKGTTANSISLIEKQNI